MIPFIRRVLSEAIALFAPPRCAGCGRVSRDAFCAGCRSGIRAVKPPLCLRCGCEMPVGVTDNRDTCSRCSGGQYRFDACRAAVHYRGPMQRAVVRFKYHRVQSLGAPLADLMAMYMVARPDLFDVFRTADMVVPVPLHWMRRIWRRFNQAEILARPVAVTLGLPLTPALRRTRNNRPQARLKIQQRRDNVKGIFSVVRGCDIKGKRIVLVDDVMTSGSTVSECAATLKKGGARKVFVYTVCRRDLDP